MWKKIIRILKLLNSHSDISFDIETTSLDYWNGELLLVGIMFNNKKFIINLAPKNNTPKTIERKINVLRKFFTIVRDKNHTLVGSNIKFDLVFLHFKGIDTTKVNVFDTMIAAQVLERGKEERFGLDKLLKRFLNVDIDKEERKNFATGIITKESLSYLFNDIKHLGKLKNVLENIAVEQASENSLQLENNLVSCLADIEVEGQILNTQKLEHFINENKAKKEVLKNEFVKMVNGDETFNINSPIQVISKLKDCGILLNSTNELILQTYLINSKDDNKNKIITKLLEVRELEKLCSTYGDNLIKKIQPDGRIRTNFNQLFTKTGRLSCGDITQSVVGKDGEYLKSKKKLNLGINFANIPAIKELRACFTSTTGKVMTIDLSSAELVILADKSKDKLLTASITEGLDLHSLLATETFKIVYNNPKFIVSSTINENLRRLHKKVLFSIIYGAVAYRIAALLNIPIKTAETVFDMLKELLPDMFNYLEHVVGKTIELGYCEINQFSGRKAYFPELLELKQFGLKHPNMQEIRRQLYNLTIQGTNADMIKQAIVDVTKTFPYYECRIINTIYDEIVIKLPPVVPDGLPEEIQLVIQNACNKYLSTLQMKSTFKVDNFWLK